MTNINFTAYVPHTKKGPECEDAPPVSETGILVVCDGTGATGLNKHTVNGETHTSAYYGSRLVSDITTKYLREHYNDIISSVTGVFKDYRADGDTREPDEQNEQPGITTDENKPESNEQPEEIPPLESIINGLAQTINRELTNFVEANGLSLEVRGASFKMLPTTLAALVYKQFEDHTAAVSINAGDSRVLMLTEKGLQQLSLDDVAQNCDAFTDNSNVTNCICQDREFTLNALVYDSLPANAVYIATSDGFTDSCKPFEQELMTTRQLATLNGDFNDTDKLTETFNKFLTDRRCSQSDDCSMAVAITGFKDKTDFANAISSRFNIVRDNFYNEYNKSLRESTDAAQEYEKKKRDTERLYAIAVENIRKFLYQSAANYLIGDGNAEHAELCNWLLSKSFIKATLNDIEQRKKTKKKRAEEIFNNAKKELQEAYLDFYTKMCQYVALSTTPHPDFPIPSYIKDALKTVYSPDLGTDDTLEDIERDYLDAKQKLDYFLNITSPFNATKTEQQYNCVITLRKQYINKQTAQLDAQNTIAGFFSMDSASYINGEYNKDFEDGFKRQNEWESYCTISDKPRLFLRSPKSSDRKSQLKKTIKESKARLDSALSKYSDACDCINNATISDDEKRSRLTSTIEENITSLTEEMRKYPEFVRKYANVDMSLINSQEEIKQAENRARELINKKNVLWAEYKPGYELFRTVNSIINARAGIE